MSLERQRGKLVHMYDFHRPQRGTETLEKEVLYQIQSFDMKIMPDPRKGFVIIKETIVYLHRAPCNRHSRCFEAESGSVSLLSFSCDEDPSATISGKYSKDKECRYTWKFATTSHSRTFHMKYELRNHLEFDERSRADTLRMNIMYGQFKPSINRFRLHVVLPLGVDLIQARLALGEENLKTLRKSHTDALHIHQEIATIIPRSTMQMKLLWIDPTSLLDIPTYSAPIVKTIRAKRPPIEFLAYDDPWNRKYPLEVDVRLMSQRHLDIWRRVDLEDSVQPSQGTHKGDGHTVSNKSLKHQTPKDLHLQSPLENPPDLLASALSEEAEVRRQEELKRSKDAIYKEAHFLQGSFKDVDRVSRSASGDDLVITPPERNDSKYPPETQSRPSSTRSLSGSSKAHEKALVLPPSNSTQATLNLDAGAKLSPEGGSHPELDSHQDFNQDLSQGLNASATAATNSELKSTQNPDTQPTQTLGKESTDDSQADFGPKNISVKDENLGTGDKLNSIPTDGTTIDSQNQQRIDTPAKVDNTNDTKDEQNRDQAKGSPPINQQATVTTNSNPNTQLPAQAKNHGPQRKNGFLSHDSDDNADDILDDVPDECEPETESESESIASSDYDSSTDSDEEKTKIPPKNASTKPIAVSKKPTGFLSESESVTSSDYDSSTDSDEEKTNIPPKNAAKKPMAAVSKKPTGFLSESESVTSSDYDSSTDSDEEKTKIPPKNAPKPMSVSKKPTQFSSESEDEYDDGWNSDSESDSEETPNKAPTKTQSDATKSVQPQQSQQSQQAIVPDKSTSVIPTTPSPKQTAKQEVNKSQSDDFAESEEETEGF
eukprot:TRINITY_DN5777_c0_g1_i2.p1 TRINITY_DN5777_c0_g1~~TRINITY_DN5777_c0_g1_i2.p1  ORF type:complete len:828 (-),score=171.19 TRINITY_DN5777_c0_g1_i2:254-2737(-)